MTLLIDGDLVYFVHSLPSGNPHKRTKKDSIHIDTTVKQYKFTINVYIFSLTDTIKHVYNTVRYLLLCYVSYKCERERRQVW